MSFMKSKIINWIAILFVVLSLGACQIAEDILSSVSSVDSTDTINPLVKITNPTNGAKVSTNFTFQGSFYDVSGLQSVLIYISPADYVYTNELDALPVGGQFGIFATELTLLNGSYYAWVVVTDKAGNSAISEKVSFQVIIGNVDLVRPVLTVSTPTNNQIVGNIVSFSGTASDADSGIRSVYIRKDNGDFYSVAVENGSWQVNVVLTNTGYHTNSIYAVDYAGNHSYTNQVVYQYVSGIPSVSIISPSSGLVTNITTLYLSGVANVDLPDSISNVAISLNGGAYTVINNITWSYALSVSQGTNKMVARAVSTSFKTNFSPEVDVIIDTTAPTASITSPANGFGFTNVSLTVSGSASDNLSGVDRVYLAVNDDGYSPVSGTTSWSQSVLLPIGTNVIKVFAKDKAGNSGSIQQITVYRTNSGSVDTTPPTLSVANPTNNASFTNSTITVNGTASDTSGVEGVYLQLNSGSFTKVNGTTTWNTNLVITVGSHTLKIYALDNAGNYSATNTISFTRNNAGTILTIHYEAPSGWGNVGMHWGFGNYIGTPPNTSMDMTPAGTDAFGPFFEVNWTSGETYLTCCFQNNNGASWDGGDRRVNLPASFPSEVWIKYNNATVYTENPNDVIPPTVSLTAPVNGATVSNTITLSANASDNIGIAKVEFYCGGSMIGLDTSAPYSINWNSQTVSNATYAITAKAYDAANNTATSSAVNITTLNTIFVTNSATTFSWDNASVYFVIPDRFYNGNTGNDESYGRVKGTGWGDFHGGDIKGLTIKLNEGYFTNLGVNVIWITAPYEQIHGWVEGKDAAFKHYAYHGYYAMDFTMMDANMGTTNDLKEFIDTAHNFGIRVVFDIVINHTGYPSIYDLNELSVDVLNSGWPSYSLGNYHNYINYSSQNWVNWWGPAWVRAGFPNYDQPGGDDLTQCLAYLPDFKTESSTPVALPPFFARKTTRAQYIANYRVRDYLIKWLTDWVRDYGVDGFRCDTAKHVGKDVWAQLKDAGVAALQDWKNNNPSKKLDDLPFWMTAEVWGHGPNKSDYHTTAKFDSVINFGYQGAVGGAAGGSYINIENTYSSYASSVNSDPTFNILSYISSHDTSIFYNGDANRQKRVGTLLFLTPGGIQVFYGDEYGRDPSSGCSDVDQHTRSAMNFGVRADVREHWGKVGRFRNRHISVGAGTHTKLSDSPYTFSRVYNKNGVVDKVICVLGATGNVTVNVSSVFANGATVRDYYSGSTATVSGGNVTFNSVGSDPQNILLLELQ